MTRLSRTSPAFLAALALAACGGAERKPSEGAAESSGVHNANAAPPPAQTANAPAPPRCDPDNGGITLPAGFCAVVVADQVGAPRHIAVAPNGDLYVALVSRGKAGSSRSGGVLALRDTTGDGKADVQEVFGSTGGTGIALEGRTLWFSPDDRVVRWTLPEGGGLVPAGQPQTVVSGLPAGSGHTAKSVAPDGRGGIFVNVGSATNACQREDRQRESPGVDPCTELEKRAGIWRFDAARTGQTQAQGTRFATGIRNAVGITVHQGQLWAMQHGRDQLSANWPRLFTDAQSANLPAEELLQVNQGDDFGWPYCYFDQNQGKRVLAPEYGGDGRQVGRCAQKKAPADTFPAHWAPEAIVFYTGNQFPARYQGGAFISFHGSWNRAPLPQQGYRVVFVPFNGGRPGRREDFANGFAGQSPTPSGPHRPMGLAQGPDGSLYVTDDTGGRIWRIVYTGAR